MRESRVIGRYIKNCRIQRGMTRKEMAKGLQLPGRTILLWEHGVSVPDLEQFYPLADLLRIPSTDPVYWQMKSAAETDQPGHGFVRILLEILLFVPITIGVYWVGCDIFSSLLCIPNWSDDMMTAAGWVSWFAMLALAPACGYLACGPLADLILRLFGKQKGQPPRQKD